MLKRMVFYAVMELADNGEWDPCGVMHPDKVEAEEELKKNPNGFLVKVTWTPCIAVEGNPRHPVGGVA